MPFPSEILLKPILIDSDQYNSLGPNINLVGYDTDIDQKSKTSKFISPNLLNWVEPYEINGVKKTLFYSEYSTNFQVGDRVWIINGLYDNNKLIELDKYKKGRDGYKVLFIDKCKIVLDIDYIGDLPYKKYVNEDDFVKIHYVNNREKFVNVNQQLTTRNGNLSYRFDIGNNNIIFAEGPGINYTPVYSEIGYPFSVMVGAISSNKNYISGYGVNLGILNSYGFFVRNGSSYWIDISKDFFHYGTFSSFTNKSNYKIKILGGDFSYKGSEFKEGFVYKWVVGPTMSTWQIDVDYLEPIITKSNFRNGIFGGEFNNGVYGNNKNKITWSGLNAKWYGGTLFNSNWSGGRFYSELSFEETYKSIIEDGGKPYQKINSNNNDGYGYNFIFNSEISSSTIYNGLIKKTKFIGVANNVVENHILSKTQSYNIEILGGYYENCNFTNTKISNSSLLNSHTLNTNIDNSKIINSQLNKSVVIDSTHISDNIIKILAYDEWNLSEYRYTNTNNSIGPSFSSGTYSILKLNNSTFNANLFDSPKVTHKMYKFYISEKDYNRLKYGYNFYIKGLKINTNANSYSNFFEKKYRIGSWYDFIEGYTSDKFYNKFVIDKNYYKQGFENVSFLSTPSDNSQILNSDFESGKFYFLAGLSYSTSGLTSSLSLTFSNQTNKYWTNTIGKNPNSNLHSVDIVMSIQDFHRRVNKSGADGLSWLNFNYDTDIINGSRSTYLGDNIDISKAYIIDSDFESGIFENSDWNGGYNINYNCDTNISSLTGSGIYNISFSQNLLTIITNQYDDKKETNFEVGDIVYLNSVYYKNGDNEVRLGDTYKVYNVNSNILNIEEISTNILAGLTQGGYFYTPLAENRWGYLSKFKFNKSKIKSGFFKRTYFTNSLIQNDIFDSNDIEMSNFEKNKKLVVSDSLFYNNNNIISSGTYIYSYFIGGSDKIIDGIIVSSIINGITFSKGSVISSTWLNGTFNGGTFHNSRSYNGVKDPDTPFYYSHNRKSYLRVGEVLSNVYNTRNSWVNGTFNGGKFYKSDWENGVFNGGTFYESKWYNGTFSNGVIGTKKTDNSKTKFYNGVIENAVVESGTLYSEDPNYSGLSFSTLIWKNGIFNNGVFGSYNTTESKNYDIREVISTPQTSTKIIDPIVKPFSYWSPLSGKTIISYNVTTSKTYATSSVYNNWNAGDEKIDEIEIVVEISASNYNDSLSNLRFTLISPNGKMILVKAFDVGKGNKYNNIRFSTNDSNSIPINLPTQDSLIDNNYSNEIFGNFKMDKSVKLDTTLYVNDEILLLNNNSQIDGDWRLMVEYNYPQFNTLQSPIIDEFKLYFYFKEYNSEIIANVDNKAIWYNGEFNGGQFINYAKWKNGIFNGGKFTSAYGWIESGNLLNNSTKEDDFSWERGTFNDGEFGNESLGENSTWFDGEFNGGEFKGRVWNNGIFSAGSFKGSGSNNPYGDMDLTSISNGFYLTSKASNFVNSFRNNFYGLWLNGIATTKKDKFIFNKKIPILLNKYKSASFKNILWVNGIFKNERATIENSVWLAGRFENGIFRNGSFNPYVKRSDTTEYSFTPDMNVVDTDSIDESIWVNGIFENGDFYISRWLNGSFKGTAIGMIFENGISNYMNAYNVTWLNGTWKNGNWYGSPFKYNNNKVNNIFIKNILNRGYYVKYVGQENNIHFWNTFQFDWYSLSEHMTARPNTISLNPVPEFTTPLNPWQTTNINTVAQVVESISKFVAPVPGYSQDSSFSYPPIVNAPENSFAGVIEAVGGSGNPGTRDTPNDRAQF